MGHRVTTLNVNTIEPAGSTLTLGASSDTIVATDSVNVNTVKDAGGNTLWVSDGSGNLSSVSSGFGDALKLISSQTASGSASISFTSGISSTYKEYIFKFYNINPATDDVGFTFQGSIDGGSNYNVVMTTTNFIAYHQESGGASVGYEGGSGSQAQGTAYQVMAVSMGSGADENCAGELHLFNPASTTYVKNFYLRTAGYVQTSTINDGFVAGYFNDTNDINAVSFKMSSGNFDGIIMMYGVL